MKDKETISKGPKRRDPVCLQLEHSLIIPKGTILRQEPGKEGKFICPAAYGHFTICGETANDHPDTFKRVVA